MATKTSAAEETKDIPSVYAKFGSILLSNGIQKSANDDRSYRALTLKNDLQVLLISDPETDKSAAALDVHVGHFSDPDNLPGLAHFLEHMLFMGTEKYPDENMYSDFLNAHGGQSNAYTACQHTNYQFDVTPPFLEKTLDMFAHFFIDPLFTAGATGRELEAVDSENQKNLQNDHWRIFQLTKTLSKSAHPYHKFGTGNLDTLKTMPESKGIDTRAALLKFHKDYYSANIMKLVILGKEPLDTLEQWAVEKFSGIPNYNIKAPAFESDPYGEGLIGRQISVVPVKDLRFLRLSFQMPTQYPNYEAKPSNYLSHLIGHEGEGSVLSLLKKKGWANELVSGVSVNEDCFSTYDITVEMTKSGLSHVNDIALVIFQYIAMLKTDGIQKWIQDESDKISAMNVKFLSKSRPFGYVKRLAEAMHLYPAHRCLLATMVFRRFDPKLIERILSLLRPDNMVMFLIAKSSHDSKNVGDSDDAILTEKWYGTKYKTKKLSPKCVALWSSPPKNDELFLPKPNPFVAEDLSIGTTSADASKLTVPRLVKETDLYRVWHKKDSTFLTPKLNVLIRLTMPAAMEGPDALVHIELFSRLLRDDINEYSYDAELAGLAYALEQSWSGMNLKFGGYSDKMQKYAAYVLSKIVSFKVDATRFKLIRDKYVLQLKNFDMEQPYNHAIYHADMCLCQPRHFWRLKLKALENATPEGLSAFITRMMKKMFIEGLFHGNISEKGAIDFMGRVESVLRPSALYASEHPSPRIVKLSDGEFYTFESDEVNSEQPNSAIQMMYQIDMETKSWTKRATLTLLAQIIKEPFFNVLRTNEQLGYLVFSGASEQWGVMGLRFIIQSVKASVGYLERRILTFVEKFRTELADMAADKFERTKNSAVALQLQKPKSLGEETNRYWSEITKRTFVFDRRKLQAAAIAKLTLTDVVAFYDKYIAASGACRSVLSSKSNGNRRQETLKEGDGNAETSDKARCAEVRIKDFDQFKRSMPLFPVLAYIPNPNASAPAKL